VVTAEQRWSKVREKIMQTKRILSAIVVSSMLAGLSGILTGCGSTKVDIFSEVSLEFSGYDGYGTATFYEGDWLDEIEDEIDEHLSNKERLEIEDAIVFSCEPTEDLSNGDTVTVSVDVDEDVLDEYKLKLESESTTFTVKGLDEVEEFDPFDDITVTFSGYAPNGSASIEKVSGGSGLDLDFELDTSSGLSNGDTVTVTVSYSSWANNYDLEGYCLSKGMAPTATEQPYTVEGLASYATALSDIPEDMLTKMDTQAQDVIPANISSQWDSENDEIFNGADLLGYYFLTTKEGYESNSLQNEIYLIYQINGDWTGYSEGDAGTFSYYYYVKFENVLLLDDGTCSVDLSVYDYPTWHGVEVTSYICNDEMSFYYKEAVGIEQDGYTSKESMFSDCVASKLDEYSYESTVE